MTLFDACKGVSAKDAAIKAGITLTQRGNKAWANCVFHAENSASLAFFEDGRYYCFGCHASGDAAMLYRQVYNLEPVAAAERLLADFGLKQGESGATSPAIPDTGKALKERVEAVRERRINELLAIKRKALAQAESIQGKTEDEMDKIINLMAVVSAAEVKIEALAYYTPKDLTEWVAKGAEINDI